MVSLVAQLAWLQLRISIVSSSVDRSCSQGNKKQGKQSQRHSSTPWSSWPANEVWLWFLYGSYMVPEGFVIQKCFNPSTNFTELKRRLQNFHESTAQRHMGQSGSVTLAVVKRDFREGPTKLNCFVCEMPGQFAKDYRRKETAQCSKCGEKGHLDRACKRQRDGGKHESVATGPALASPAEEHWAAHTQWKTAGMLVDSGCTDHIVTNDDAFLDFVPIQSMARNPNGEASKVVARGCVGISIPSNKEEFQCQIKNVFLCAWLFFNLLSVSRCTECGHSFVFEKKNIYMKVQKGTRVKLKQENILFYLPCSVLEFKKSSNIVKLDSARNWHRRLGHLNQADVARNAPETVGNSMMYAMSQNIGQDHKDCSTKSGRDPSRKEAGQGVHRGDRTFQSRVTDRVQVLHCVCRPVYEDCVCWLA